MGIAHVEERALILNGPINSEGFLSMSLAEEVVGYGSLVRKLRWEYFDAFLKGSKTLGLVS